MEVRSTKVPKRAREAIGYHPEMARLVISLPARKLSRPRILDRRCLRKMTNVTPVAGFLAEFAGGRRATLRKQSRLDMETLQKAVVSRSPAFRSARDTILFARNFLKYPQMLGSVIPSSPFLVNQLLARFDWGRASVVVEYGPGVGNITREVLKRMRPDAVLVAIELNPDFVRFLRAEI